MKISTNEVTVVLNIEETIDYAYYIRNDLHKLFNNFLVQNKINNLGNREKIIEDFLKLNENKVINMTILATFGGIRFIKDNLITELINIYIKEIGGN